MKHCIKIKYIVDYFYESLCIGNVHSLPEKYHVKKYYSIVKKEAPMYTCVIDTPLGPIRAAAETTALTGLWFAGQRYYPEDTAVWINMPDQAIFGLLRGWLESYFEGKNPEPLPLAPQGTPFQQLVWTLLLKIPYGQTTTYGTLAAQLTGASPRAVGGAVGHNPISLLIPCHRVIGADGSLTGYAGGIDRKKALLSLERHCPEHHCMEHSPLRGPCN
jgi:methylated-DNA-[protein]-cysteine S-methyltransferase